MSLMGPKGFQEVGETIIQRAHYAISSLSDLPGVRVLFPDNAFKEFVVNFDDTGKTVKGLNKALLDHQVFGE